MDLGLCSVDLMLCSVGLVLYVCILCYICGGFGLSGVAGLLQGFYLPSVGVGCYSVGVRLRGYLVCFMVGFCGVCVVFRSWVVVFLLDFGFGCLSACFL